MAWTVNKKKMYEREITDPESGEAATVTLRKLTEGDYQDRDGLSISMRLEQRRRRKGRKGRKQNADTEMDFTPGRVRLFEIERSLISWTLPFELSLIAIKSLDPEVAKQIHDHIIDLNPYFFDDGEDEEEDEDFEGDDEDEEDERLNEGELHQFPNGASPEDNPADNAQRDSEQQFGEYDGPKGNAATN